MTVFAIRLPSSPGTGEDAPVEVLVEFPRS
jgi:hypothetical protein